MLLSAEQRFQITDPIFVMPYRQFDNERHCHEYFEMVYVTSGQGLHLLDGHSCPISAGDFFIVDYGAYHRYETVDNQPFDIVNILFKPSIVDSALSNCHSFFEVCTSCFIRLNIGRQTKFDYIYHDTDEEVAGLVEKITAEYGANRVGKNELLRCLLIELIIRFVRENSSCSSYENYHPCTKVMIEFIEEHFADNIGLEECSRTLNYSVPYLSKQFKSDTGSGFHTYLEAVRLQQALRLLLKSAKKVYEISDLTGFSDIKRFYKIFKESYHTSPGQYRMKMRE